MRECAYATVQARDSHHGHFHSCSFHTRALIEKGSLSNVKAAMLLTKVGCACLLGGDDQFVVVATECGLKSEKKYNFWKLHRWLKG